MMNLEITNRIIKLFLNQKHVKSLPKTLEPVLELFNSEIVSRLNLKKKTLTDADYEIINPLVFGELLKLHLEFIKKYEKYVFELVEGKKCLGVRFVNSKNGKRHEAIFENKVAIRVDEYLYRFAENKLPTVHLNY